VRMSGLATTAALAAVIGGCGSSTTTTTSTTATGSSQKAGLVAIALAAEGGRRGELVKIAEEIETP
jgi:hypothetical protein